MRRALTVIMAYIHIVLGVTIGILIWYHYTPRQDGEKRASHDFERRYYAALAGEKGVISRIWEGDINGPKPYMHVYSGGCVIDGCYLTQLLPWSSSAFVCLNEVKMCTELKVPEGCEAHCFPWAVDTEGRKFSDFSHHGMAIFRGGEKVYFTDYSKPGFWLFVKRGKK